MASEPSGLTRASFQLEDGVQWRGYTKGEEWNGFAVAYFPRATAVAILKHIGATKIRMRGPDITYLSPEGNADSIAQDSANPGKYDFQGWAFSQAPAAETMGPKQWIVLAGTTTENVPTGGEVRIDLGERRKFKEVTTPTTVLWMREGDAEDVEKAKAYVAAQGHPEGQLSHGSNWRVFTYPLTEEDPLGRAKLDVMKTRPRKGNPVETSEWKYVVDIGEDATTARALADAKAMARDFVREPKKSRGRGFHAVERAVVLARQPDESKKPVFAAWRPKNGTRIVETTDPKVAATIYREMMAPFEKTPVKPLPPIAGPSIREIQDAAIFLGPARTDQIVGRGGLSGAPIGSLVKLVEEADRQRAVRGNPIGPAAAAAAMAVGAMLPFVPPPGPGDLLDPLILSSGAAALVHANPTEESIEQARRRLRELVSNAKTVEDFTRIRAIVADAGISPTLMSDALAGDYYSLERVHRGLRYQIVNARAFQIVAYEEALAASPGRRENPDVRGEYLHAGSAAARMRANGWHELGGIHGAFTQRLDDRQDQAWDALVEQVSDDLIDDPDDKARLQSLDFLREFFTEEDLPVPPELAKATQLVRTTEYDDILGEYARVWFR